MNFTAVLSAMDFSKVVERVNIDCTRLTRAATKAYFDRNDGPEDLTEWSMQWIIWLIVDGILQACNMVWEEREAVLMYSHLLLAALFPIYIGSHASLRRPPSAGAKKRTVEDGDDDEDEIVVEPTIEGLTPSDAIMFPVLAGITLAGLYFLIKWLKDPALLNKILGWYFSALGVFGVGKLATDALNVGTSFIFPSVWSSKMRTYHVDPLLSQQVTGEVSRARIQAHRQIVPDITNPFPGRLSSKKFSEKTTKKLWALRGLLKNHWIFKGYLHNVFSIKSKVYIQDITGFLLGLAAITLYNTWGKLWFLTNLIAFGFCYGTLQLMSPTTFWTGSLVLAGLFIYDITMVFYTPLMVTVATSLDVPIKLVFPGLGGKKGSMLGLGDVVLPGIMMALALRFDLYLYYLHKQTVSTSPAIADPSESSSTKITHPGPTATKAPYVEATGVWGERFWTWGARDVDNETVADGARFSKVYFTASLIGYITAMIVTLVVLKIFDHAQPALLYLVPGVLISLWGTAFVRGELPLMWGYTEDGSLDDPKLDSDISTQTTGPGFQSKIKDKKVEIGHKDETEEKVKDKKAETDAHSLSSFDTSDEDEDVEADEDSHTSDPEEFGPISGKKVWNGIKQVKGNAKGTESVMEKEVLKKEKNTTKEEKVKKENNSDTVFSFSLTAPKKQGLPKKAKLFEGA